MTPAEQQEKLDICIARVLAGNVSEAQWAAHYPEEHWRLEEAREICSAIFAAGFSIVGPEITKEMIVEGERWGAQIDLAAGIFKAMLAAGDIAQSSE